MGEVELEENVLVIRRIHLRMSLKTEEAYWETAIRVHGLFADKCPAATDFELPKRLLYAPAVVTFKKSERSQTHSCSSTGKRGRV